MALRQMFKKHDEFVEQAGELQDYVDTNFRDEILYERFCDHLMEGDPMSKLIDLEALL